MIRFMPQAPDYSLIVPAYNEQAQLPQTLPAMIAAMQGVEKASGVVGELIVADNNSSDDTAEVAKRLGARVVFEPVNMISKARNAGARAAEAPVLIFVDADTSPSAELIGAAMEAIKTPGCCGGGATLILEPTPSFIVRRLLGVWNVASRLLGWPAGCFFFCRRDAFEEVEGFNEALYASEEVWLARRLKKWGRPKRMTMRILPELVSTSSRKMDKPVRMFSMLLVMFVFPFAVRFKGLCGYWYKREDAGVKSA